MNPFESYFHDLQQTPPEHITEFSHRGKLETLLNALAPNNIKVLMEPRRERGIGAPDFQITKKGSIVGYVENKAIDGESLDKVLISQQLKNYQKLSENILLTNYIEWILVRNGKPVMREQLCYRYDLENRKATLSKEKIQSVALIIQKFFEAELEPINNPKKLAEALAERARRLKIYLYEELQRQEKEHQEGRLYELYKSFRDSVFHELQLEQFADAFTQNLVYGLFLARLNADTNEKEINLYNAIKYIPTSFELIKELVDFLKELDKPEYLASKWIVEEVISIVNNINLQAINRSLFYRINKRKNLFNETEISYRDPFVYFYEYFLGVYDKKLRKSKGVYYTPPPIVHFIINAVQHVLKTSFGFKEGLADENVTVLDFATGTGTFLLEVFEQILAQLPKDAGNRDLLIKERLQKSMYGFENMIAPYTVAHLKLSQYLKEQGYAIQQNERLHIYLTNTLEPADLVTQQIPYLPALTQEGRNAQIIKNKHILVITGNPPYSGISKNKGKWISNLIDDYKKLEGGEWKERKHWLGDDYVKFIRFAQHKMEYETIYDEKSKSYKNIPNDKNGIVAIITNHSFLDNPTFNGMRQSLLKTFDHLYFLDLHGNYKKKEKSIQSDDENVFDQIQQGVAISILVKNKSLEKKVFHADWWGKREDKYQMAWETKFNEVDWKEIKPNFPLYFFAPRDQTDLVQYNSFWGVDEIFDKNNVAIVTARDKFCIDFDKKKLEERINEFVSNSISDEILKEKFKLKNTSTFNLQKSRERLKKLNEAEIKVFYEYIHYRPFDKRNIFYNSNIVERRIYNLMQHMLIGDNVGIVTRRQQLNDITYFFVSKYMICDGLIRSDNKGSESLFPLYLYEQNNGGYVRKTNFTNKFSSYTSELYGDMKPEKILSYIYSIFFSNAYRDKYAEYIRSDFPRIPFTEDKKLFAELSKLGAQLIALHLAEKTGDSWQGYKPEDFKIFTTSDENKNTIAQYTGGGSHKVEEVRFELLKDSEMPSAILQQLVPQEKQLGRIYINKNKYFNYVPQSVWQMQIGGHKVLEKWLKDRQKANRELSTDETKFYPQIAKTLCVTQYLMTQIDSFTAPWI